jgi:hypothetical protein
MSIRPRDFVGIFVMVFTKKKPLYGLEEELIIG